VLLRGGGSLRHVSATTHRTHLHVHARLGVTLALSPNVAGRHTTMVVRFSVLGATPGETASTRSASAPSARGSRAPTAAHRSYAAATFVHASHRTSVDEMVARRVTSISELVSRWQRVSSIASRSRELPMEMRRRAVRRELPVPDKTTALARGRIDATVAARDHDAVSRPEVARARPDWAAAQPAASPMTVDTITSHVIQQLDRRLIAYRERMGRV
jgi:hypothetical protein